MDFQLPDPPEWHGLARCAEVDPELFYPEKGGRATEALGICGRCEVRVECLDYALEREKVHSCVGIWGGKTARDRERMLGKRPPKGIPAVRVADRAAAGPGGGTADSPLPEEGPAAAPNTAGGRDAHL